MLIGNNSKRTPRSNDHRHVQRPGKSCARGEALTARDKVIHEQGLVSVLKKLTRHLDAAASDATAGRTIFPTNRSSNAWWR